MKTLCLKIKPLLPHEVLVCTQITVLAKVIQSDPQQSLRSQIEKDKGEWTAYAAEGGYYKTNDLWNRLQSLPTSNGPLVNTLRWNGVSMWQFLPSFLWPAFFKAVELIDVLGPLIQSSTPEQIAFFPVFDFTDPVWKGSVRAVAEREGITCLELKPPIPQFNKFLFDLYWSLKDFGLGHILRRYRRVRDSFIQRYFVKPAKPFRPSNDTVLCGTLGARHWMKKGEDPTRPYDEQFYPLLPALGKKGFTQFYLVDCQNSSPTSLTSRETNTVFWRSFHSFGKLELGESFRRWWYFVTFWRDLRRDPLFLKEFQYQGCSLYKPLSRELRRAFTDVLLECAELLSMARRILLFVKPKALIVTYEAGPYARSLVIEAKRLKIPSVSLQHGMVFDNHYDYMHANIVQDPFGDRPGFVVPNKHCSWGHFWKSNLEKKGHYPSETIEVTGNWRYDTLLADKPEEHRQFEEKLRKKIQSPENRKLVLILSSGQSFVEFIRKCLIELRERVDIYPFIKLNDVDDPKLIHQMLKDFGYPHEIIVEGQLIPHIRIADVVISQYSTCVAEAILLEKPTILVDFEGLKFSNFYQKSGACLFVRDPKNLGIAVSKALHDERTKNELTGGRKQFIPDVFFEVDGRSAERVAQVVEGIVT